MCVCVGGWGGGAMQCQSLVEGEDKRARSGRWEDGGRHWKWQCRRRAAAKSGVGEYIRSVEVAENTEKVSNALSLVQIVS